MKKILMTLGVFSAVAIPAGIVASILIKKSDSEELNLKNGFTGKFSSKKKEMEFKSIKTEIKPGQFKGETGLTSVYLPNVKKVGAKAFADSPLIYFSCHAGAKVAPDAHKTLKKSKNTYKGKFIASKGHPAEWIKWKFVTLGTLANDNYFQDQIHLTSISLHGVTNIGEKAFENSPLTSVDLPNVKIIGSRAFFRSKLKKLELPESTWIGDWAFYSSPLTSISLPLVETIGEATFACAPELTDVELPMAKVIGAAAFRLSKITTLKLPKLKLPEILKVGEKAFENEVINTNVGN